jgi:hypothetical protein
MRTGKEVCKGATNTACVQHEHCICMRGYIAENSWHAVLRVLLLLQPAGCRCVQRPQLSPRAGAAAAYT